MKYNVPKGTCMLVANTVNELKHHQSKHSKVYAAGDEMVFAGEEDSVKFTLDVGVVGVEPKVFTVADLFRGRFRCFYTGHDDYPLIFVVPEAMQELGECVGGCGRPPESDSNYCHECSEAYPWP